jgi:hypothetical protein
MIATSSHVIDFANIDRSNAGTAVAGDRADLDAAVRWLLSGRPAVMSGLDSSSPARPRRRQPDSGPSARLAWQLQRSVLLAWHV